MNVMMALVLSSDHLEPRENCPRLAYEALAGCGATALDLGVMP
jgi:hypothetical protein